MHTYRNVLSWICSSNLVVGTSESSIIHHILNMLTVGLFLFHRYHFILQLNSNSGTQYNNWNKLRVLIVVWKERKKLEVEESYNDTTYKNIRFYFSCLFLTSLGWKHWGQPASILRPAISLLSINGWNSTCNHLRIFYLKTCNRNLF